MRANSRKPTDPRIPAAPGEIDMTNLVDSYRRVSPPPLPANLDRPRPAPPLPQSGPIRDVAPSDGILTNYDEQHMAVYQRLLDAEAEGEVWQDVARGMLRIDPLREPERARRSWHSHLARAKWMMQSGYRHLLRNGAYR